MFALKKFLVTSLSLIAISASVLPNVFSVSAYAEDVSIDQQEISGNENYTFTLNEEAKTRIDLFVKLDKVLTFSNDLLRLTVSDNILKDDFKLSDSELLLVKNIIAQYNHGVLSANTNIQPRALIKDWHLFLSPDDQRGIMSAVVGVGPAALAGALAAAMSIVPGAGTIVGAAIGFFGAATVLKAMSDAALNNKWLKIGPSGISAVTKP
ncbi:MAG: hypothetical protein E6536_12140 [Enterococcus faecalis]|uniref:hypothetical protein n=1 Tax=Enterococcus faecalis TaxID=1351 RepID=UPI000AFC11DC|nr:hypothetical protein [Enterococcus faecalis]EIW2162965.1 hypothetical protein [Enterococcus faecalis]EKC6686302.1 hypothetical protein [Enterococcus faecalis]MDU2475988.1 hypothetical protein [Enterococcus faecalis]MDU3972552.1 hypothetical protein [Enterococcus faecalis]MDU6500313.1 hypothetical protein [Enterococcus faecalis]